MKITQSKEARVLFSTVVNQVYRYYQFIGNIALALAIDAVILWRVSAKAKPEPDGSQPYENLKWVATVLSLFLLFTAYQQFKGWCRVHSQITSSVEQREARTVTGTPLTITTATEATSTGSEPSTR